MGQPSETATELQKTYSNHIKLGQEPNLTAMSKRVEKLKDNILQDFLFKYDNYQQIQPTGDFCMATYIQLNQCLGLHYQNELDLQKAVYEIYGDFIEEDASKVSKDYDHNNILFT